MILTPEQFERKMSNISEFARLEFGNEFGGMTMLIHTTEQTDENGEELGKAMLGMYDKTGFIDTMFVPIGLYDSLLKAIVKELSNYSEKLGIK